MSGWFLEVMIFPYIWEAVSLLYNDNNSCRNILNFHVSWFLSCAVDTLSPSRLMTSQGLVTALESSSSNPAVTASSPSPWETLVPLSPGRLPLNQRASPSVWSTEKAQRHHWSRLKWDPGIHINATPSLRRLLIACFTVLLVLSKMLVPLPRSKSTISTFYISFTSK